MLVGSLSAQTLRQVYLRGVDLGDAWAGANADAALTHLLMQQVAQAEALMGIHFQRWRVATLPETDAAYDVLGQPQTYVPLTPDETAYRLKLTHHDVHAVTRVRLLTGWSADAVPLPVFQTLPLPSMTFPMPEERLVIPADLVPSPGLAWAVDYLMGMGMLPVEIEEWCMLGAAIEVLSLGAVAEDVTHGLSGESLTMDGIEERVTYGGYREAGGIYAGPIAILRDRRADIDLAALRFRYQNTLGDRTQFPADAVIPYRVPAFAPVVAS